MNLHNKVAIVTGGAVRVGRAITLRLAQAGCKILLHYNRSASPAQKTQQEAVALGAQVEIFSADLSTPDAPTKIVEAALAHFGRVDILINSAAIYPSNDTFATTDANLFDTLMAINLRAPFLLSQAFAKAVGDQQQAKIINVTDARVSRFQPDHFVYRFTKQSLSAMTKMLPQVVCPNITVNGVALGAILPPPDADDSYFEQVVKPRIPINMTGNATVVTDTIIFLLTQDFINGDIITLDGGEFLG
ncbi:MAG: SDR family oxidoreductase [Candidatus Promineifilaceae bacterium]